jgi:predicted nucleotidyltransferase
MAQRGLLGKIVSVLRDDPRVRAAWLAGSRARGTSDRYSDTDVWAVTAAQDRTALMADWPALARRVGPLVLCQRVGVLPVW